MTEPAANAVDQAAGGQPLDQTPLHARHYADASAFVSAEIVENIELARDTYRVRVAAPEIAGRIAPGQFVMLRLAGCDDPLLGRAFAMYDVVCDAAGEAVAMDIVYVVHGKLTSALCRRQPGDLVELWGPLGNGFAGDAENTEPLDRLILVAGGIGYTPFLACGKEALGGATYGGAEAERAALKAKNVTMCYGVRTADLLAGETDFRSAGIDLRVASDDGSVGHHGLVTDLLRQVLDESADETRRVACCGPEPMMEAVAGVCRDTAGGVPCEVSLETPMACGLGVCFSCVAKVLQPDGEWDYKRTCVEGPVFDAAKIVW